ncbi:hypothetical protein ACQ4PT_001158 [Festuca glaucescens]
MANFLVDPSPFIPGHFEILEVPHRPQQCRYHVNGHVSAKHEDLANATITLGLPDNQPFAATRRAVKDFGALISWDKEASTYGALIAKMSAHYPSDRASFYFSKEGTTAWSSHFKPDGSIVSTVTVPAQWADFFTAKLPTPEDFDWAKNLLQSRIWQILSELDAPTDADSRAFVLPRQCPSQNPPVCTLSLASTEATQGFLTPQAPRRLTNGQAHSSTSALYLRNRKSKVPLACSEVRRSNRIKALHKGYKAKTCFDKNCLACAAVAPPVKKLVVKNLCAKFNISEEEDEEADTQDDLPVVPAGSKQKNTKRGANADKKNDPKKK